MDIKKPTVAFRRRMINWVRGRQLGNYHKLKLLINQWVIPFDLYIIRFLEGSYIPPHIDNVKGGKHYRLNITLIKPKDGGEFNCDTCIIRVWRVVLFRPDLHTHYLTTVNKGNLYILSFGLLIKD